MFNFLTSKLQQTNERPYSLIQEQLPPLFKKIPDEICKLIFGKLNIQSLVNLSMVDKRFEKISNSNYFWKAFVDELHLKYSSKTDNLYKKIFSNHCTKLKFVAKKSKAVYAKKASKTTTTVDEIKSLSTVLQGRDKLELWFEITYLKGLHPISLNIKKDIDKSKNIHTDMINSNYNTIITYCSLFNSCLISIPFEIYILQSLTSLRLPLNYIEEIPEEVGLLTNLTSLNLSNNYLRKLPNCIRNLTKLKFLSLSHNHLHSISKVSSITSLFKLSISNNDIKQLINLNQFTNLQKLSVSNNDAMKVAPSLLPISNLRKLKISTNQNNEELQSLMHDSKMKFKLVIQKPSNNDFSFNFILSMKQDECKIDFIKPTTFDLYTQVNSKNDI